MNHIPAMNEQHIRSLYCMVDTLIQIFNSITCKNISLFIQYIYHYLHSNGALLPRSNICTKLPAGKKSHITNTSFTNTGNSQTHTYITKTISSSQKDAYMQWGLLQSSNTIVSEPVAYSHMSHRFKFEFSDSVSAVVRS